MKPHRRKAQPNPRFLVAEGGREFEVIHWFAGVGGAKQTAVILRGLDGLRLAITDDSTGGEMYRLTPIEMAEPGDVRGAP